MRSVAALATLGCAGALLATACGSTVTTGGGEVGLPTSVNGEAAGAGGRLQVGTPSDGVATAPGSGTATSPSDGPSTGAPGQAGGSPSAAAETESDRSGSPSPSDPAPEAGGERSESAPRSGGETAPGAPEATGPDEGRGFDDETVRIGIGTADNASEMGDALGVNFNFGDTRAYARAVLDDLNRRGGVLGREVEPVFHNDGAAGSDYQTRAQAACTTWTQDRPVAAVANSVAAIMNETLYGCLAQHETPMVTSMLAPIDEPIFARYAPYLYATGYMNYTRLVPVWIDRLAAQHYFEPDAVIGLFRPDSPIGERVAQNIRRTLQQRGLQVKTEFAHRTTIEGGSQDASAAVLRFRSEGVTHLLGVDSTVALFFAPAAEQQGYRPRYGLNTFAALGSLMQTTAPPSQLRGALAVGFLPASDVDNARDPGDLSSNEARCREIMVEAGHDPQGNRLTEWVQQIMCDMIWLWEAAASAAGQFDAASLERGMLSLGDSFESALTFRSRFGPGRYDGAIGVRDVAYGEDCGCFSYVDQQVHEAP